MITSPLSSVKDRGRIVLSGWECFSRSLRRNGGLSGRARGSGDPSRDMMRKENVDMAEEQPGLEVAK